MRKFDKLLNIEKANILVESLYLGSKNNLNELSPELKQKAHDKAMYQASVYGNGNDKTTYNPLKSSRRYQQAHAIGNYLAKKYSDSVDSIGTYLGLNGRIQKYSSGDEPLIVLSFTKKDDNGRVIDSLGYEIYKNRYTPSVGNNVQIPDNFGRRIERLILLLQKDELSTPEQANEL